MDIFSIEAMMSEFPILSILIFSPLVGVIVLTLLKNSIAEKYIALASSLFTGFLSILVAIAFNPDAPGFQFKEQKTWFEAYNISYYVGIDGISLLFIMLTTILVPICILSSFHSVKDNLKQYLICFLVLECLIIGVFSALDMLVFYIFFEAMLIPMFFIIGIWGGEDRVYAAIKFFLYTLAGSVFLLLAIIYIYTQTDTLSIPELQVLVSKFSLPVQKIIWVAMFISFAVKVPMWPFHTWLTDAHVQAPTAGSVILAGILLKMGGYGFLRFSLPMLPDASSDLACYIYRLSVIAVIYASFVAMMQTNMKKLIAYSSIAHMGFVTLGIFTFNVQGIIGSMFQMISHGLVSAALFLCIGVLYDRMHTKEIAKYGGVVNKMPKFALVFMLFTMASIGLPGTSGFVGEFLVLIGTYPVSKLFCALAASGVVLGAAYMLGLYKKIMFGEITNEEVSLLKDLTFREIIIFLPLIILTILLGIYPVIITDLLATPVGEIVTNQFMRVK